MNYLAHPNDSLATHALRMAERAARFASIFSPPILDSKTVETRNDK